MGIQRKELNVQLLDKIEQLLNGLSPSRVKSSHKTSKLHFLSMSFYSVLLDLVLISLNSSLSIKLSEWKPKIIKIHSFPLFSKYYGFHNYQYFLVCFYKKSNTCFMNLVYCNHYFLYAYPVFEFNEFKSRLKSPKNRL